MIKKRNAEKAFTLVEMAIGVLTIGLIITPIFAFIAQQKEEKEKENVRILNEEVLSSLDIYFKQNGYYPCPADPTLGPSAAGGAFGRGNGTNTGNCTAANITCTTAGSLPAGNIVNVCIGALPVKELNLPFRYAANTSGWKYIYAVSQNLTSAAGYDGVGHIRVQDQPGNSLKPNGLLFLVVDPGRDGKGSYHLLGGAQKFCALATADNENCDGDATFEEADFNDSLPAGDVGNPGDPNFYDDTLLYRQNEQDNSFWLVQKVKTAGDNKIDVVNRNMGDVGIGIAAPGAKLDVNGGNIRIEADNAAGGGNLNVDQDITAVRNITADNNVQATQKVMSPSFVYK